MASPPSLGGRDKFHDVDAIRRRGRWAPPTTVLIFTSGPAASSARLGWKDSA